MAIHILKRLLHTLPTMLGVALVVFVLLRVVPGDPIALMVIGEATPESIQQLRQTYGFDKPIAHQFVIYLGDLVQGDFGTSISLKQDVLSLVLGRLPATLELAAVAMALSLVFGIASGLVAAHWRGTWIEAAVDAVSSVALAVPEFLWAMLLILVLGVLWPVLPISGRIDPVLTTEFSTNFYFLEALLTGRPELAWELLQSLILPATALALPLMAIIGRVLKTSVAEALVQDYVTLARVKGFGEGRILVREALPNALLPTLTVTGVHFAFLVGGTVLVELIFSFPGIGNMLYGAAVNRDLPLLQGVTFVFAGIFILLNLAIDLLYSVVNPRIRHQ